MHVIRIHLFLYVMRETGAIARPHGIDITHIGFKVQELAGLLHVHPVSRLILIQPFLPERGFRNAQVSGDTTDVFFCIGGRHGLAAVGAFQTIRTLPDFLICFNGHFMKTFRRLLFHLAQEAPHAPFVAQNDLSKAT